MAVSEITDDNTKNVKINDIAYNRNPFLRLNSKNKCLLILSGIKNNIWTTTVMIKIIIAKLKL